MHGNRPYLFGNLGTPSVNGRIVLPELSLNDVSLKFKGATKP